MATISNTGRRTIERAYACGWVHGNGRFGPGRFLNLSKDERRSFIRNQARANKADNRWVPVTIINTEEVSA